MSYCPCLSRYSLHFIGGQIAPSSTPIHCAILGHLTYFSAKLGIVSRSGSSGCCQAHPGTTVDSSLLMYWSLGKDKGTANYSCCFDLRCFPLNFFVGTLACSMVLHYLTRQHSHQHLGDSPHSHSEERILNTIALRWDLLMVASKSSDSVTLTSY